MRSPAPSVGGRPVHARVAAHGLRRDDQIVLVEISGNLMPGIVKHARLVTYDGGSHGLLITQKDRLNADLLAFLRS